MPEDRVDDEYEVDLRDYLRVLWEGKWIILITFLVAVGTALALSSTIPKRYQAETSLLILPPLSQEVGGKVGGTVFSPETYKRLALAGDLLQTVIEKVYPNESRPSLASLQSSMNVEIEQSTAKEFPGRFPLYLRVTFTGTNPGLLQKTAQVWAQTFTEKNTQLFLTRTAQSYDYIKQNFDDVAHELMTKEKERTSYKQKNPLSIIQSEVTTLQNLYNSYLRTLPTTQQNLAVQQAKLSALKAELAKEPEYFTLDRGLSREALWEFLSSGLSSREASSLSDLTIHDQVLNSAYVNLRNQVATLEASVAGLMVQVSYLKSEEEKTGKALNDKQAYLAEVQETMDRLNRETQALKNIYNSLAAKLQEAKIARAETAEPIKIIEQPVLPTRAISPNKKMNVAVAGVLGLFVGVLLAFFAHFLQSGDNHEEQKTLLESSPHCEDTD